MLGFPKCYNFLMGLPFPLTTGEEVVQLKNTQFFEKKCCSFHPFPFINSALPSYEGFTFYLPLLTTTPSSPFTPF